MFTKSVTLYIPEYFLMGKIPYQCEKFYILFYNCESNSWNSEMWPCLHIKKETLYGAIFIKCKFVCFLPSSGLQPVPAWSPGVALLYLWCHKEHGLGNTECIDYLPTALPWQNSPLKNWHFEKSKYRDKLFCNKNGTKV